MISQHKHGNTYVYAWWSFNKIIFGTYSGENFCQEWEGFFLLFHSWEKARDILGQQQKKEMWKITDIADFMDLGNS